jgi:hypothetical protein
VTKRWKQRARRTFRRRWVQVSLVLLFWLMVMVVTVSRYGPKTPAKGAAQDTSKFKYVHCDNCKLELPYNPDLVEKRCPRCQPPKEGFFVPSEFSVKSRLGQTNPWTPIYVALFIETVAMLALVTYLLYRPVPDPTSAYFIVSCPYCNQRLRYRAVSHGGQGACSRCKRILRFPEEEDAVSEVQALKAEEEAALAQAAAAAAEADAEAAAEADALAAAEAEAAAAAAAEAEAAAAPEPEPEPAPKPTRPKRPKPKTK